MHSTGVWWRPTLGGRLQLLLLLLLWLRQLRLRLLEALEESAVAPPRRPYRQAAARAGSS